MSKGPTIGDWTQYGWIPDDVSSFPARIRLRNSAWMVYYEPDAVVQRERAERLELREQNVELRDENAKLRELVRKALASHQKMCTQRGNCFGCQFFGPKFSDGPCSILNVLQDASELGVEVGE